MHYLIKQINRLEILCLFLKKLNFYQKYKIMNYLRTSHEIS